MSEIQKLKEEYDAHHEAEEEALHAMRIIPLVLDAVFVSTVMCIAAVVLVVLFR